MAQHPGLDADCDGGAADPPHQTPEMWRHRFGSLQIGGVTQRDPMLWVARVRVTPFVNALLGADWLAMQRRVWISFTTSQVFFTAD